MFKLLIPKHDMALNIEGGQEMEVRMAVVHFPRISKSLL